MTDQLTSQLPSPALHPVADPKPKRRDIGAHLTRLVHAHRAELIDAGALLTMIMVAMWTFRSSYGGVGFLLVGLVSAVAGIAVAGLGSINKWPILVIAACAVVVFALLSTWLALRHYAFLGVIPTPRSLLESFSSSVTGWKELITTVPPVGSTGDLMIIPVFVGFFGGLISYAAARRLGYVAVVLAAPLVITGLGIAVGVNSPVSVVINGAVLGIVMVSWLAWREGARRPANIGANHPYRRLALTAVTLGLAALLGFFVAPRLPGGDGNRAIWRQTVTPPFDPRVYPSPLAGYRKYVKPGYDANNQPNPAKVMFTVEGLPKGVPVRLATMDSYDGLVWQVSGGDPDNPSLQDSGSFERIGARLAPDTEGKHAEVTITIGEYADVWIPDVGEVVSIRFTGSAGGPKRDRQLTDSLRYNRATDTAATPLRLQKGDRYVMQVRLPNVVERLKGKPVEPKVPNLGTVRSVPAITQTLALPEILANNDTGARLDQIRDLMFHSGAYSDGDRLANQIIVSAGHSEARLSTFTADFPRRPMVGNAEQFSATYALLFRDLGNAPTRVVMGFMPKDSSENAPIDVVQTEAEAWVEVPVADLGWVGIFPTPPRDQTELSISTPERPEPNYRTQNPPPPPLVDPEFDQPAKATGKAKNPVAATTKQPDPEPAQDQSSLLSNPSARRAALAATPLILILVPIIVIALIKIMRRRRRRVRGAHHQRIANGWREVTDLSTDLGRPVPPSNTRREAAAFVGESSVALAERADAAVWSGADLTDADVDEYWADLHATLRSIRSNVTWRQRIRSYFSIQSLKRSTKGGRSGETGQRKRSAS